MRPMRWTSTHAAPPPRAPRSAARQLRRRRRRGGVCACMIPIISHRDRCGATMSLPMSEDLPEDLPDIDYERLLSFRTGLRRFLRWSEEKVESLALTPSQHQLMLAIRGPSDPRCPTIGEAAA